MAISGLVSRRLWRVMRARASGLDAAGLELGITVIARRHPLAFLGRGLQIPDRLETSLKSVREPAKMAGSLVGAS
jgi:hypothetical protein